MNTTELLIANGQLVADTLRHLADNEIDSDYFAITSTSENGAEIEHELVITDYALQAASTVEALVEALESAQRKIAELEARAVTVKFQPIPMSELGNKCDGAKHPYMFGAGYNSATVRCGSELERACAASGIKCEVKEE